MMNSDRRPYCTRDGYLGVNVYTDKHWHRFFALAGKPEMSQDPRFTDIGGRTENIGLLYGFLAEVLESKTTAEWVQILTEADIPAIEMNTPETLLDDPHMKDVGFFVEQEHPTEGLLRALGIPQHWSEDTPEFRYPAPRLGEHSVQVLSEYGFDSGEIDRLVSTGAVHTPETLAARTGS
jgi:formyl-CoA transferase